MRAGVEIGHAKVRVRDSARPLGTHAYSMLGSTDAEHTAGPRLDVIATGPALVEKASASTPPMPGAADQGPSDAPSRRSAVESVPQLMLIGLHRSASP